MAYRQSNTLYMVTSGSDCVLKIVCIVVKMNRPDVVAGTNATIITTCFEQLHCQFFSDLFVHYKFK